MEWNERRRHGSSFSEPFKHYGAAAVGSVSNFITGWRNWCDYFTSALVPLHIRSVCALRQCRCLSLPPTLHHMPWLASVVCHCCPCSTSYTRRRRTASVPLLCPVNYESHQLGWPGSVVTIQHTPLSAWRPAPGFGTKLVLPGYVFYLGGCVRICASLHVCVDCFAPGFGTELVLPGYGCYLGVCVCACTKLCIVCFYSGFGTK